MKRSYKRIFALFAIIFITFLPVMTPTVYAVTSWEGDPWNGSPWNGDPWDGSELEWSGDSWKGDSWNGDSWTQDGWNGDRWEQSGWNRDGWNQNGWTNQGWDGSTTEGNSWSTNGWDTSHFEGNPWLSSGWSMYGFEGNPWLDSGWTGNGGNGNPWSQDGWNQNGTQGNPWSNNGFNSGPFNGNGTNGNGTSGPGTSIGPAGPIDPTDPNAPFYDTDGFKASKFVFDNMMNAAIDLETNFPNGFNPLDPGNFSPDFYKSFLVDSIKFQLGDHTLVDLYDMGEKSKETYDAYRTLDGFRQAAFNANAASMVNPNQLSTASKFSQYGSLIKDSAMDVFRNTDIANVQSTWGSMGVVSKLNLVASGVNAGISAYKTGESIGNAINTWQSTSDGSERTAAIADVGANLGETLMSVGGVASAIPGGQALGAGLLVVGGGLFVVSKGTQLIAKNWDSIAATGKKVGKAISDGVKKAGKAVVDGAKKLGSTIKGWFS